MNVLYLINSYRLGGAEKLSYDYARILKEGNSINIIFCSIGKIENDTELEISNKLKDEGFIVLSLEKKEHKSRISTVRKLMDICSEYSIDIVQSNGPSPNFYSRVAKIFKRNIKTVACIHSTTGYSFMIEKFLAYFTNLYVAVSEPAYRYCKNELKICKKTELLENGIIVNNYLNIKNSGNQFTILSVGRLNPIKNYEKAISSVASFMRNNKDVIWKIYGDFSEHKDYYFKILGLLKSEEIIDQVKFCGVEQEPSKIYSNSSCFLLTSIEEGFGLSFIEAMICRIPVLSTKVGVIENLENLGAFYINIDEKNAGNELQYIHDNKGCYEDRLLKNVDIIKEFYSLEAQCKKLVRLYTTLY